MQFWVQTNPIPVIHKNMYLMLVKVDKQGIKMNLLRRDTRKSDKFINEAERLMGESMYSTTNTTIESLYPSRSLP